MKSNSIISKENKVPLKLDNSGVDLTIYKTYMLGNWVTLKKEKVKPKVKKIQWIIQLDDKKHLKT